MAQRSLNFLLCRRSWGMSRKAYHNSIRCSSSGGMSYYHNPGKEPLKHITVGRLLEEAAAKWPDRNALISVHEDRNLTFSLIQQESDMLASGLLKLGLKPGDRIGMIGPNNCDWYMVFMAASKAGLILVNINPAFQADEIKHCLKKAGIKALVCEEEYKSQQYYNMVCSVIPEIQNTPSGSYIKSQDLPDFKMLIMNTEKNLSGAWRLKDIKTNISDDFRKIERLVQPDDPCNIQFSSGTTGLPKPALLNHFTIVNNSHIYGRVHGYNTKHHSICIQVPFFHTFGMVLGLLCGMNHGCTLVLPSPGFNPLETIKTLKKIKCSIIYGTPTMYIDLCNKIKELNDEELNQKLGIEVIVSGGAVCTPSLFKLMSETLKCTYVASAYGMTETSPILMTNKPDEPFELRTTTVGYVAEHTEVKVVDENGKLVPFGTPGEAWFRSYSTMLGYYGNEQATDEAITKCRWIKTGDLFILYENGYGKVIGRKKDVIIRGGENIFPIEIEEFFEKHPDILEAQVFGVADERMGEETCAAVLLKPNRTSTSEQIREYCKGKELKLSTRNLEWKQWIGVSALIMSRIKLKSYEQSERAGLASCDEKNLRVRSFYLQHLNCLFAVNSRIRMTTCG